MSERTQEQREEQRAILRKALADPLTTPTNRAACSEVLEQAERLEKVERGQVEDVSRPRYCPSCGVWCRPDEHYCGGSSASAPQPAEHEQRERPLYYAIEMRRKDPASSKNARSWQIWQWNSPVDGGKWNSLEEAEATLPRWTEIHGDRWERRFVEVVSRPMAPTERREEPRDRTLILGEIDQAALQRVHAGYRSPSPAREVPKEPRCMGSHEGGGCAHPRHNPETGYHDLPLARAGRGDERGAQVPDDATLLEQTAKHGRHVGRVFLNAAVCSAMDRAAAALRAYGEQREPVAWREEAFHDTHGWLSLGCVDGPMPPVLMEDGVRRRVVPLFTGSPAPQYTEEK